MTAQEVTVSLIDVELWGEAEGGRIKISLPLKWSFAGGSRCWGSLLHFPSQVGAVDPKLGPSTIPFDGNAFNDPLHVADLPAVAVTLQPFSFSIFTPNIVPNGHMWPVGR